MLTIDALREYGADVDLGLARCLGNDALYLRLVNAVFDDPFFERLADSLSRKDYKQAFESAHALKGVLGNLSLTPLYEAASALTEELRGQEEKDYSGYLQKVQEEKQRLDLLRMAE